MEECIFCKIVRKEIPAKIVYEDEKVLAFEDIDPKAPVHILFIPKEHTALHHEVKDTALYRDIFDSIQGYLKDHPEIQEKGYRIVTNCQEDAGQTVFHIHFHLLAGRIFGWPPG